MQKLLEYSSKIVKILMKEHAMLHVSLNVYIMTLDQIYLKK